MFFFKIKTKDDGDWNWQGTRKKCKKTTQAAMIQWQRQCVMYKPHRKPWQKSKTGDISKQGLSSLHHNFLRGRARFTAQPLSALFDIMWLRDAVVMSAHKWPAHQWSSQ